MFNAFGSFHAGSSVSSESKRLPSRHRVFSVAAVILLAGHCFFPFSASAATAPITGGGGNIFIDFVNSSAGRVVAVGDLPAIPNYSPAGAQVDVNFGGITRSYVLNANGKAIRTPDFFEIRDNRGGLSFVLNALDNNLLTTLAPAGITNATASAQVVTLNLSLTVAGNTYSADLAGKYYATAGKSGRLYLGFVIPPKDPLNPKTQFKTVFASPNPTPANQQILIKGTVDLTDFTGVVFSRLEFGDLTPVMDIRGSSLQTLLKNGIPHTYAADGIYRTRLTVVGINQIAETNFYVVVGKNYNVNPKNGAYTQMVKSPGGAVALNFTVNNIPGATTAQTTFKDYTSFFAISGPHPRPGLQLNRAAPTGTFNGLSASAVFTLPGIYVSESKALDVNNNVIGIFRTTIPISLADIGTSPAAQPAASGAEQAAPRDADNPITLSSISGKFNFSSTTSSDKFTFNGTVGLPAGYNPKLSTGNDISLAMGNVIDIVHLDSKGHFKGPSTNTFMKTFKLTVPKLATGVAVGGEIAKLSMSMTTPNLDIQGFDSDGISVSLREDEQGQSPVSRFIQIDVLISGQTYSVLAPVNYSLAANATIGNVTARAGQ